MKNGHMIFGQRYTNAIRNEAGTSTKMFNLSQKIVEVPDNNLQEIHMISNYITDFSSRDLANNNQRPLKK